MASGLISVTIRAARIARDSYYDSQWAVTVAGAGLAIVRSALSFFQAESCGGGWKREHDAVVRQGP